MGSEDGFSAPQFPAQESAWPGQGGQAAVNYQAAPQAQAPQYYQAAPQAQAPQYYQAAPQAQIPQYYQAAPQAQAPQQAVLPKNPALGVIISFFIPGVGSMVNGDATRGVIILVVYIVGWILAFFLIGIPIVFGAWVWGLVDGYLSAQRWNLAHGIVS
jgi:TM2 domain-containing membrane protein YozV